MKKLELRKLIREELQNIEDDYSVKVIWTDRDYNPQEKVFTQSPNDPPNTNIKKAEAFIRKLEQEDKQSKYGLYRDIQLIHPQINETPQPQIAEPETKPDTDTEPDTVPRRRKLRHPSTTPETRPKAMFNENEKDLLKKITSRFSNLKKKK